MVDRLPLGLERNSRLLWFYCTLFLRHFPSKREAIATSSHVFRSSSDWFIALFRSAVIGQNNYFSFGLQYSVETLPTKITTLHARKSKADLTRLV